MWAGNGDILLFRHNLKPFLLTNKIGELVGQYDTREAATGAVREQTKRECGGKNGPARRVRRARPRPLALGSCLPAGRSVLLRPRSVQSGSNQYRMPCHARYVKSQRICHPAKGEGAVVFVGAEYVGVSLDTGGDVLLRIEGFAPDGGIVHELATPVWGMPAAG